MGPRTVRFTGTSPCVGALAIAWKELACAWSRPAAPWLATRDEHGFRTHTPRSAWRRREHVIDVVNFQAAAVDGDRVFMGKAGYAPFGSFAVNVGVYFAFQSIVPFAPVLPGFVRDPERPEEWHCQRRARLDRIAHAIDSAFPTELGPVGEDGADAEAAVADALQSIRAHGLSWFAANSDLQGIFDEYRDWCWSLLRRSSAQDAFFQREDIIVAAAIALGRIDESRRPALLRYDHFAARRLSLVPPRVQHRARSCWCEPSASDGPCVALGVEDAYGLRDGRRSDEAAARGCAARDRSVARADVPVTGGD